MAAAQRGKTEMDDIQMLERQICEMCDVLGEVYVRYFKVAGAKVECITIDDAAIYPEPSDACNDALRAFRRAWEGADRPTGMFWRMKPKMQRYETDKGDCYAVRMRIAFVD